MKRKDGFTGQLAVNIPGSVIQEAAINGLINLLFPVDIGYYPVAKYHYREREKGCAEFILIYCVGGKGWFQYNGKPRQDVQPGNFFILPPGISHQYGASKDDPWSIYWVHFSGSNAVKFAENETNILQSIAYQEKDEHAQLFEEIIGTLSGGISDENMAYSCGCLNYLLSLFKFSHIHYRNRNPRTNDFLELAVIFMKNNLHRKLNLSEVAAACKLSPSHFSTLFRQRTNRSPMEYFTLLKIQRACHLLDNSNLRIKEVAQMLGINDPFYFSRIFGKVMLVTPSEYRNQKKG